MFFFLGKGVSGWLAGVAPEYYSTTLNVAYSLQTTEGPMKNIFLSLFKDINDDIR